MKKVSADEAGKYFASRETSEGISNHTAGQEALREPGRVQVHGVACIAESSNHAQIKRTPREWFGNRRLGDRVAV